MKTIRIADIKPNDVVDGEGICVSVWLQGCPHHCKGCHNPETWNFNGGIEYEQDMLIFQIIKLLKKNNIKRDLSILGGEPLCPENREFTKNLAKTVKKEYNDIKIYCWTGYTLEQLDNQYLEDIDILIDGPFVLENRDITLKFRGSPNQRILYKGKDF